MRAPERVTYDASLPLGAHRSGGIFTPDGTGGGTLAWVEVELVYRSAGGSPGHPGGGEPVLAGERRVLREIRKEAYRA